MDKIPALPPKFQWLLSIGALPKLLAEGLKHYGLKEFTGKDKNNPTIMQMAADLGVQGLYLNDETSWCALFMCWLCWKVKKPMPFTGYQILRAMSFHVPGWGKAVNLSDAWLADVVVFNRPGGNHVALFIAMQGDYVIVFGGNQSNSAIFGAIHKSRVLDVRRLYEVGAPESAKHYLMNDTGLLPSHNEA